MLLFEPDAEVLLRALTKTCSHVFTLNGWMTRLDCRLQERCIIGSMASDEGILSCCFSPTYLSDSREELCTV